MTEGPSPPAAAPPTRLLRETRPSLFQLIIVAVLLGGALLVRMEGIAKPSVQSREMHNALVARQLYLGDGRGLPAAQQQVLRALGEVVRPIEPPLLDFLAAAGFRLAGSEQLWIPRFASAALWVVGGLFLYLIARRLTTVEGALVALALYLFWPYGAWLSRLYMPDGTMIALLLAGGLTVIRYWERPSRTRLLAAGAVSALAAAIKPGVALIFLVALFVAIALAKRSLREAVLRGRLPLFVAMASTFVVVYYVYGMYFRDFLAAQSAGRVEPGLIGTTWFWSGWWEMVSIVLPFPQTRALLAVVPVAAALAGLLVAERGMPRAVLSGLLLGYLAFAFAVPGYTASHPYYALPLIPIFALAIGTLCGFVLERLRFAAPAARPLLFAFIGLAIGIAVFKSHAVLSGPAPTRSIEDYRRIGEVTGHTTRAIVVDMRLRSPISYWGWIVARYWYPPTPAQDLPLSGDPFPGWMDPAEAEFLVVVEMSELASEPRLQAFTRKLPVLERTERYAVFDLRGGRAIAAERASRIGG